MGIHIYLNFQQTPMYITKKTSKVLLLTFMLISTQLASASLKFTHESTHDEYMKGKKIHSIQTSPKNNRVLQDNTDEIQEWRKMRIGFDWSLVDAFLTQNPSLRSKVNFMKKILKTSKDYFENRLDVLSTAQMDLSSLTNCHGEKLHSQFRRSVEKDLV